MRTWAKYIVILLVAAFVAEYTVQFTQAAQMDIQMSAFMESGGGCTNCTDGCEANGCDASAIACTSHCVFASVALPAADLADVPPADSVALIPVRKTGMAGWRAPPDPFLPSTFPDALTADRQDSDKCRLAVRHCRCVGRCPCTMFAYEKLIR